ncbi:MAG: flagellar hook-associated protein FlgK [Thermoleophilaceae bacterium]
MQSGYQGTRSTELGQAEMGLGEPGPTGISAQLSKFWNGWNDLSNDPSSGAARQALVDQGSNLAAAISTLDSQLALVKAQTAAQYAAITGPQGDVVQIATEIASLNGAIARSQQNGDKPNDLLDRRDLLLDRLSKLGQVSVTNLASGSIQVTLGDAPPPPVVDDQTVNWPQTLTSPGGQLGALLDISKTGGTIDSYRADLNATAKTLADTVNAIHATGVPAGVNFFTYTAGSEAATLKVAVSAAGVVTSTTGAPDANDIALQIARLRGGAADKSYSALVTRIGGEVRNAKTSETNATVLLSAIEAHRQSAAGVSMDEEMSKLMRFQRGYQASGRAMSTFDEMLDQLINRTGKVGL